MPPETPNPFQSPETPGAMQQPSVRPNVFDWVFMIFLGLLITVCVFPIACFGSLNLTQAITGPIFEGTVWKGVIICALIALCADLALYLGYRGALRYRKAIKNSPVEKSKAAES